jgi:hypothetical protein
MLPFGESKMKTEQQPKIVVLGRMCLDPCGGVVWQALHYLVALKELGFDVYYVESHSNWVADPCNPSANPDVPRVMIGDVLERLGFADRWVCRAAHADNSKVFGSLSREKLKNIYAEAQAIINVTATNILDEDQLSCDRRIYLETDPGFPQIKLHEGDAKMRDFVRSHTHHFTFAENLGQPDCGIPKPDLHYYRTRQPVLLNHWEAPIDSECSRFTTIAKWTGGRKKEIKFNGDFYPWRKDLEFRKILDLPARSKQPVELALSWIGHDDQKMLEENGWRVVDARALSASIHEYRRYIQQSRGEFTVTKDQYVRLRSGWFSDRSACYLAAGRPVITGDTGFGHVLPTGEGLFAFETMDHILAAFDAINSNYEKHCRAARDIAHEYFDAKKVVTDLLHQTGLDVPGENRNTGTHAVVSAKSSS